MAKIVAWPKNCDGGRIGLIFEKQTVKPPGTGPGGVDVTDDTLG